MRGSEFNFDTVDLFSYHLQKINLKRDRSYIDSPEWLKSKKATIIMIIVMMKIMMIIAFIMF